MKIHKKLCKHDERLRLIPAEDDPIFALFIEALYLDSMENPHRLTDISTIFDDEINKILEGIDVPDDENRRPSGRHSKLKNTSS